MRGRQTKTIAKSVGVPAEAIPGLDTSHPTCGRQAETVDAAHRRRAPRIRRGHAPPMGREPAP
jgi:hypothetical protein